MYVECKGVRGNMKLLTRIGYLSIDQLIDQEIEIWNGFLWIKVRPCVSGWNQPITQIMFTGGLEITCTHLQEFPLKHRTRKKSTELRSGYLLATYFLPDLDFDLWGKSPMVKRIIDLEIKSVQDIGRISTVYFVNEPKYNVYIVKRS